MICVPVTTRCLSAVLVISLLSVGRGWSAEQTPAPGSLGAARAAGRPVRVVSINFAPPQPLTNVLALIDQEGRKGADLIVLPETWLGQNDSSLQPADNPVVRELAARARQHRTYIVSPLDLEREGRRYNSALVLDRNGKLVGQYDKVFPYWSEYDLKRPVQPGRDAPVFDTDFGRIGVAICFDVNFPEVWQQLADRGAELVVWPSAYSSGSHLQAYALLHHFYIVTATHTGDCQVYDITGERLLDETGRGVRASRIVLDLDRGIYHSNFNDVEGFVRAHSDSVTLEKFMEREAWYIVRAKRPGVSARKLAKEFGLEELRDYITRSREAITQKRGASLAAESQARGNVK